MCLLSQQSSRGCRQVLPHSATRARVPWDQGGLGEGVDPSPRWCAAQSAARIWGGLREVFWSQMEQDSARGVCAHVRVCRCTHIGVYVCGCVGVRQVMWWKKEGEWRDCTIIHALPTDEEAPPGGGDQAAVLLPSAGCQRHQGTQPPAQEPILCPPQDRPCLYSHQHGASGHLQPWLGSYSQVRCRCTDLSSGFAVQNKRLWIFCASHIILSLSNPPSILLHLSLFSLVFPFPSASCVLS